MLGSVGRPTRVGTPAASRHGPTGHGGGSHGDFGKIVPVLDGRPHVLEHFEEEVGLYRVGAKERFKPSFGPRSVRVHPVGSKQRIVAMGFTMRVMCSAEGPP